MLRGRRSARPAQATAGPAEPARGEPSDHPPPSLRSIALRLLARRDWAREELAERLRARGGDAAAVTATLDELTALGFLSDARYAEALVARRRGAFGRRAIAQVLKERRISPDIAQAALEPLAAVDETADAYALWLRRFGTPPKDERDKARHVRFLMSRGYSTSVALKVLRRAGAVVEDNTPDS